MKKILHIGILTFFLLIINLICYKSASSSDITSLHFLRTEKARKLSNIKPLEYKINLKVEKDNNLDFQVKLKFISKEDKS